MFVTSCQAIQTSAGEHLSVYRTGQLCLYKTFSFKLLLKKEFLTQSPLDQYRYVAVVTTTDISSMVHSVQFSSLSVRSELS